MWREYNANPKARRADDCTIRAISTVMDRPWEEIYMEICLEGLLACDMPSANHVWGSYLKKNGFEKHVLPNTCPDCYTVEQFTREHTNGKYIVAVQNHVLAVIDGDYLDTWDSGDEVPVFYWQKGE